jgi:predicted Rossmann-fold nucleotide-binding protein
VRGRYLGITEPGIIAAEPPNPIVNHLVIMPDIEKRLEAFVRLAHGIVVFPGGAGTAEEIFYLLGILLDPANAAQPFPVVLTGPRGSDDYFRHIDAFLVGTLGERVRRCYRIIVDDPAEVAREMHRGMGAVREFRRRESDAYNFNWLLRIPRTCRSRSSRVTRRWRRCSCGATCRRTGWPRSCGARSPASWLATSRSRGCG